MDAVAHQRRDLIVRQARVAEGPNGPPADRLANLFKEALVRARMRIIRTQHRVSGAATEIVRQKDLVIRFQVSSQQLGLRFKARQQLGVECLNIPDIDDLLNGGHHRASLIEIADSPSEVCPNFVYIFRTNGGTGKITHCHSITGCS